MALQQKPLIILKKVNAGKAPGYSGALFLYANSYIMFYSLIFPSASFPILYNAGARGIEMRMRRGRDERRA